MRNGLNAGWACGCAALLMSAGAYAQQVDVKLTLAYTVFVVGEPVVMQFDLLNTTREQIDIGGTNASARLLIEVNKNGQSYELAPSGTAPFVPTVQIQPGQPFQHKLALDKWFSVEDAGKYLVRVVVVHRGMRYESAKKSFDVVPGIPLGGGTQMFAKREKLTRQFKLVYWHRNQNDRLFLRIEDDEGARIWDSIDLGSLMRSTPPKLDISPDGEVTVIHRATQDAFLRTVLWSLPNSLEVVERNQLVDPDISASQRVNALYGEGDGDGKQKRSKSAWWKFW
ncbi:MAG: hypothetical protein LBW77_07005 [Verrucomicrobiota bacterium]|jgi:hypothetical protein|nr:hypothetical protein [Verrucomicrobiota bacterium]